MKHCAVQKSVTWSVGPQRALALDRPRLMGVLNVTPDSFSDGGSYASVEAAVDHAVRMIDDGACIIDVGGESTRPGAARVGVDEQIARTVPVIQQLSRCRDVLISIDTTSSVVAEAALKAGADIINDVSAGRDDERMFTLAAERGCGLVLMHRLTSPQHDAYSDQYAHDPIYEDVVQAVCEFLGERCETAISHGVDRNAITVDPGLGFGKSKEQNFVLIRRLQEIMRIGFPVLSAASRKSFIGAATNVSTPSKRVIGSTAVSVAHWLGGVRLFRVHDVAAHREALAVAASICPAT